MKLSRVHPWLVLSVCVASLMVTTISQGEGKAFGQSQASEHYFQQTGHTVGELFYTYWSEHGGLRQQGYPVSEGLQEVSETDGKSYKVQYFERALFEYHPENKPPYNVLLGLIGVSAFQARYPNGMPEQKPNNSPGSVFFPQTGKRLGGSFLLYWNRYGGLQQQGYPISDEVQEVSKTDGKLYTVQYFERAVMEYHPGATPPYDVQLSLLGAQRYESTHPGQVPSANSSHPIATGVLGVIGANNRLLYTKPAANEQYPLYGQAIYSYDRYSNKETRLVSSATPKLKITSDGKMLVWLEKQGDKGVIQGYDLATQQQSAIVDVPTTYSSYSYMALGDGVLYYQDRKEGHTGLFARNLSSGEEQAISATGSDPVAKDGVLLWTEQRDDGQYLHMLRLDGTKRDTVLARSYGPPDFYGYDVSGSNVVYANSVGENWYMHLYNSNDGTDRVIPNSHYGTGPHVNGNRVLWTVAQGGPCIVHCGADADYLKIMSYSISDNATQTVLDYNKLHPAAQALLDRDTLAYTTTDAANPRTRSLYLLTLPTLR